MLLSFFDQDKKGVFKYKNTVLSSFRVFLRVGGQCPNLFVKIPKHFFETSRCAMKPRKYEGGSHF